MTIWECELNWPDAAGGFVGRSTRDCRDEKIIAALATMSGERVLVQVQQVHGGDIAIVGTDAVRDGGEVMLPAVDGLVTDLPDVALAIYVADCLAIFAACDDGRAIGLAHAGWRGLVAEMPGNLVRAMQEISDCSAGELRIALSPCIRGCCFEVGEEVARHFDHIPGAVDRSRAKPHVDMIAVAKAQLEAAGVSPERIEGMDGCTRCDPERFASYRWDPERCGRNVALIGRG